MEISFQSAKLQKLCNSQSKLVGKYGPRHAAVIQRRLLDLEAAETLEVMTTLPGRCHELVGNLAGCLAVDLVHPDRLVFAVANDPRPVNESGALEWQKVTAIEVVGIGNYHGS
jgi:plasmid maintenance system killer protein